MQGDIVAVYSNNGTKLISYVYDAWGYTYTNYHNSGSSTTAVNNPFTYRGYYSDKDLGLYYLQTRYYDSFVGRFISPDHASVLTATPDALTDKNLYAYCDNNPVMRVDGDGEFWNIVIGAAIGLAGQLVSDLINSAIKGELSFSHWTDYVSATLGGAVGALIPGAGIGANLVRNIVSEGISITVDVIAGQDVNVVESVMNVGLGTIIDTGFEMVSNKVGDFIKSKMPQNYSSYANAARKSNPNLTREQIYGNMQRSIKVNRFATKASSIGFDFVRSFLPY